MSADTAGTPPRFDHLDDGTPEAAWAALPELAGVRVLDASDLLRPDGHLVVLAAHPDDESLGAGGLIATAAAAGARVDLLVATLGEASHPHSPTHTPAQLAARRRLEVAAAARALDAGHGRVVLHQLDLPDGGLVRCEEALDAGLADVVAPGSWLAAPWRADAHPDHAAVGAAAARAATGAGCTLLEMPVWAWHWALPAAKSFAGIAPWSSLAALPLSPAARAAKRLATATHTSQVLPLSPASGDEAVVAPDFAAHFERAAEVFVVTPTPGDEPCDQRTQQREDQR